MNVNLKEENEFIEKIKKVYEECIGYETYGDTTEFFDEDGVVLMTATQENDGIKFSFNSIDEFIYTIDD